jgi:hypothetical protein
VSRVLDGVPLVGHAKGAIHYAAGDTEGGHQAMRSATRTTGKQLCFLFFQTEF